MKINLFIMRHGHSPLHASDDYNRILSELGSQQAKESGDFIEKNKEYGTCHIVTSAAKRTLMTSHCVAQQLSSQPVITPLTELYGCVVGDWCQQINKYAAENLILVGHNPTISQLCEYLSQQLTPAFSPATVVQLQLDLAQDGLTIPAQLIEIFVPQQQ